jgi:dCTP deaminase
MTALSYEALVARLQSPHPSRRLVITPLLDPKQQLKKTQAGIDIRLGRSFSLVKPWTQGAAEQFEFGPGASHREPAIEPVVLEFGEPLIIHPHQFVLARTLEFVRLPSDLLAYVIGRSSWGRRGLIVATAVIVHPGFAGPITLELKNVGEVPITLYPLDCIAQLALHEVRDAGPHPPHGSQFSSTFTPTLGRVRDSATELHIRNMAQRRLGSRNKPST